VTADVGLPVAVNVHAGDPTFRHFCSYNCLTMKFEY